LLPLASAVISTTFVNLNHLTQLVSATRQGGANTAYRSAGLLGSILAPLVATRLIELQGNYWPTFSAMGGCLLLAIIWLHRYPLAEPIAVWRGWRAELAPMVALYSRALHEPRLMRVMLLTTLFTSFAWAGVQSFFAIRLTRELGVSDAAYGNYCAWSSLTALLGVLGQGLWLDKVSVKRSVLLQYGGMVLGLLGMGFGETPEVVAWSFILTALLLNSSGPPTSMWWSREAGQAGLSACFAVQKVINAVALGLATWLCGWLVQHLTIAQVFLWSAGAIIPLLLGLALLPDPTAKRLSVEPATG
jgi:MFS family permease